MFETKRDTTEQKKSTFPKLEQLFQSCEFLSGMEQIIENHALIDTHLTMSEILTSAEKYITNTPLCTYEAQANELYKNAKSDNKLNLKTEEEEKYILELLANYMINTKISKLQNVPEMIAGQTTDYAKRDRMIITLIENKTNPQYNPILDLEESLQALTRRKEREKDTEKIIQKHYINSSDARNNTNTI